MNQTKPTAQTLLTLALAFALPVTLPALSASDAAAQECSQDTDCASGDRCELYASMETCSVDDQGTVTCDETTEATVGVCYTPPTPCMSDAECNAFTECVFLEYDLPVITEGCDPQGNCPPPDATPEMTPEVTPSEGLCAPRFVSCQADSECPSDFRCELYTYEVGCAAPPALCVEGEECPEAEPVDCGDVEPVTEGTCVPNEIECESDAACPADWRCVQIEEGYCGGGTIEGSAGSASGAPEEDPVDSPDPRPAPPAEMGGAMGGAMGGESFMDPCVTTTRSLCVPEGWGAGSPYGAQASDARETGAVGGELASPETSPESPSVAEGGVEGAPAASNDVESGGCDAAGGRGTGRGTAHLTLLALALIALRALSRRSISRSISRS